MPCPRGEVSARDVRHGAPASVLEKAHAAWDWPMVQARRRFQWFNGLSFSGALYIYIAAVPRPKKRRLVLRAPWRRSWTSASWRRGMAGIVVRQFGRIYIYIYLYLYSARANGAENDKRLVLTAIGLDLTFLEIKGRSTKPPEKLNLLQRVNSNQVGVKAGS